MTVGGRRDEAAEAARGAAPAPGNGRIEDEPGLVVSARRGEVANKQKQVVRRYERGEERIRVGEAARMLTAPRG